jgi:hypothetical protein
VTRTTTNPVAFAQEEYLTGLGQRICLPGASVDAGFTGMEEAPSAHGAAMLDNARELPVARILARTKFGGKT